ncbi:cysteine protease [Methanospirillum stamsii]|uniref:Cysteine protease n=2 Tax=Methanospirillum stamsii TaxID=1277351 RepID=A0A2V2N6L0_9EURY|nr:cysteine protease [Methanospirillum stamsii]
MVGPNNKFGMGWLHDYPDFRDYTPDYDKISPTRKALGQKDSIKSMLSQVGLENLAKKKMENSVDLRQWFPPVENQEDIGSCTAHAGVGMLEYFEKRAFGKHIDASRLFLYKVTRNLLQLTGDTGAYLRSTMGALTLFGVPPEKFWPYNVEDYEKEPSAFCYAYAQNYQAINYYRLDSSRIAGEELLRRIKANLSAGLPIMFGFTVYSSYQQSNQAGENIGKIPYPAFGEDVVGGHAVIAAGYDDNMKIKNKNVYSKETTGAILIRNSWSEEWGEKGYGWLPYDYILNGLADDWWSILKNEWVDSGQFGE